MLLDMLPAIQEPSTGVPRLVMLVRKSWEDKIEGRRQSLQKQLSKSARLSVRLMSIR